MKNTDWAAISCSGKAMGFGERALLIVGFSVTILGKLLNS